MRGGRVINIRVRVGNSGDRCQSGIVARGGQFSALTVVFERFCRSVYYTCCCTAAVAN